MSSPERISVEPLCMRLRGFSMESLFAPEFIKELKAAMPSAVLGHFYVGFSDTDDTVAVSHDRKAGKIITDYVDIEGGSPEKIQTVINVIKKVGK